MLTSSRDDWERLVAAVLRREEDWQLAHAHSRSTSIGTLSSNDSSRFLSRQTSSLASVLPRVPPAKSTPFPGSLVCPHCLMITACNHAHYSIANDYSSEVYGRHLRRYSLTELEVATDKFSARNILARAAFGNVYRGRLADGSSVSVKRLKEDVNRRLWFQSALEISIMAAHPNILSLLGFCIASAEWLLVYPFLCDGSVASCLWDRSESQPPLDWPTRIRIATGSAKALAHLHDDCGPKIIHSNFTSVSVLLDENFEAVVGGFALAKLVDHSYTDLETDVWGAIGCMAPECHSTGRCSEKVDVFSYGILLLELITGSTRFSYDGVVMSPDVVAGIVRDKKWETLVDANLGGNYVQEEVEQLLQLAMLCTSYSPMSRPEMSEIVKILEIDYDLASRQENSPDKEILHQESSPRPGEQEEELMLSQEFISTWWKEWQEEEILHQEFSVRQKMKAGFSGRTPVVSPIHLCIFIFTCILLIWLKDLCALDIRDLRGLINCPG